MVSPDPAATVVGVLAAYNFVQNVVIPERAYVPANLAMTAGLVAFAHRSGTSLESLGLGRAGLREGLRLGGAVGVGAGVAALGASSTRRFDRWLLDRRARGHGSAEAAYRVIARFPLGTALFEEVAFRGVLDALWRRRSGTSAARFVSAVAFGTWHILPTYRQYAEMGAAAGSTPSVGQRSVAACTGAVVTGLAGIGFTVLRERSGTVAAPWLAHASINTLSYLVARHKWALDSASSRDMRASNSGDQRLQPAACRTRRTRFTGDDRYSPGG